MSSYPVSVNVWFALSPYQSGPVMDMPVPSSYNDITSSKELQLFVGWVWYDRDFFVSPDWKSKRVKLCVDSAHYYTKVVSNSQKLINTLCSVVVYKRVLACHVSDPFTMMVNGLGLDHNFAKIDLYSIGSTVLNSNVTGCKLLFVWLCITTCSYMSSCC